MKAASWSPSSLDASATIRAFSGTVQTFGFGLSGTTLGNLRASASHRDRFCCRTPVSSDSCLALIASFPISRSTIFCLNVSEYGLVTSFLSHAPVA